MVKIDRGFDKGFTMVEMLVVVAIIAIMAAIVFPAIMSQMAHIRLKRTTMDITVAMQAARLKAIAKNTRYKVYIVQGGVDSYQLMFCDKAVGVCPNATLGAGDGWTADTTSEYGTAKSVAGGINITSPAASSQTIFYPAGTATNEANTTGNQTICIQNNADTTDKMSLDIRAATGKVSVATGC